MPLLPKLEIPMKLVSEIRYTPGFENRLKRFMLLAADVPWAGPGKQVYGKDDVIEYTTFWRHHIFGWYAVDLDGLDNSPGWIEITSHVNKFEYLTDYLKTLLSARAGIPEAGGKLIRK